MPAAVAHYELAVVVDVVVDEDGGVPGVGDVHPRQLDGVVLVIVTAPKAPSRLRDSSMCRSCPRSDGEVPASLNTA
jgi:hypothetical protein